MDRHFRRRYVVHSRSHPADVNILDVASGLSRVCRYGGQIKHDIQSYPVSEHSVLMLEWLEGQGGIECVEDALRVLLHDGSEAFLGDMTSPLKALMPEFRKIEDRCQMAIDQSFGIHFSTLPYRTIKTVDLRIRMDERDALISEPALSEAKRATWEHTPEMEGLGVPIRGLLPSAARDEFLSTFLRICQTYDYGNPKTESLILRHIETAERFLGVSPATQPVFS